MTFFDKLKAHVGGLISIKTQLYWYKEGKWDRAHERVYLLLDAYDTTPFNLDATTRPPPPGGSYDYAVASLSIDGAPKLVWLYQDTVELLK